MKQIRRSIFETNSSSTHSLTIDEWKEVDEYNFDPIFLLRQKQFWDPDLAKGSIKSLNPAFLDFGWSEPYFEGSRESFKLSYLITLLAQEKNSTSDDKIQGKGHYDEKKREYVYSDAYEEFKKDVSRIVSPYKISVNWPEMKEEKPEDYGSTNGHIDHQSYDFAKDLFKYLVPWASDHYYGSISKEMQEDYDNRMLNYLFNSNVKLDISSDG